MRFQESLEAILPRLTNEQLKWYLRFFTQNLPSTKQSLVTALQPYLFDLKSMQQIWDKLLPEQRALVSYVLHKADGVYDSQLLRMRFGAAAQLSSIRVFQFYIIGRSVETPPALDMLFYPNRQNQYVIPRELAQLLLTFVPLPRKPELPSTAELPKVHEVFELSKGETAEQLDASISVTVVDTERAVFHDISATLQLIDQGKIGISNKTRQPTLATVKLLAKQLLLSDYTDADYKRAENAIRPFALVMLVQIAKWATVSTSSASKLELTKRGRALLSTQLEAEHIREIWQAWVKDNSLEPLTRISSIHGLHARGVRLTKPTQRRKVLEEILQQLPPERWVETHGFLRWVRQSGYDLNAEPENNASPIYIGDDINLGWVGYSHINYWEALIGSYILVELFEYVATLGLIEVAYTAPEEVLRPFGDSSLFEVFLNNDEPFSRYEGLFAFRITKLGRYVLGLAPTYMPPAYPTETSEPMLTVLPNLELVITNQAACTLLDTAMLERMAVAQSENVYQLQRDLVMESVTNGISLEQLMQFLLAKSAQTSFPPLIQGFFDDVERRLNALREGGRMIVFEGDRYLLAELANLSALRNIVQLATVGERSVLLVPEEHETAVRRHIKKRGYIPRKG